MIHYLESFDGTAERKIEISKSDRTFEVQKISPYSSKKVSLSSFYKFLVCVFLPQGYPQSVSSDYLAYQKWDTVQAFASSMTGALATEAVLRGAGVGNEKASVLATALTWLVKDGLGMVGRITFTFFKGTDLDCNPKKWRLVADILNDVAFFIDLLSPAFPPLFFPFACTSSLFRCVVGVAGGATRTSIVQHQAVRNNLADVAAKDGSQETLVNVAALIASLILLPLVSGKQSLVWTLYLFFTFVHLYSNYRAVRSLSLKSLNKNRAAILIQSYLAKQTVPTVKDCNSLEPLFYSTCGTRHLGCSILKIEKYLHCSPKTDLIQEDQYILMLDKRRNIGMAAISESLADQLLPFFHLQCVAAGKVFDIQSYQLFRKSLSSSSYDLNTLHLGYKGWTFKQIF
ncbi:unnamed protein product [Auanema sp. JU1783]|nr:unnamed protein product [Auanema sp. JU1783]